VCSQESPDQLQQSQEAQVLQELQQVQQHKRELLQKQNQLEQLEKQRREWQDQWDQLKSQLDEVDRRGQRSVAHGRQRMMRGVPTKHAAQQLTDECNALVWERQQLQQAVDRKKQEGTVFEQLKQKRQQLKEESDKIKEQLKQIQHKWSELQLQKRQRQARAALHGPSELKQSYLVAATAAATCIHLLLRLCEVWPTPTGKHASPGTIDTLTVWRACDVACSPVVACIVGASLHQLCLARQNRVDGLVELRKQQHMSKSTNLQLCTAFL
jgi:uncharacterized phage infection (PIP) family protein YhgE